MCLLYSFAITSLRYVGIMKNMKRLIAISTCVILAFAACAEDTEGEKQIKEVLSKIVLPSPVDEIKLVDQDISTQGPNSYFSSPSGAITAEYRDHRVKKGHELNLSVAYFSDPKERDVFVRFYTSHQRGRHLVGAVVEKQNVMTLRVDGDQNYIWLSGKSYVVKIEAESIDAVPMPLIKALLKTLPSEMKKDEWKRFQQPPERDK